MTVKTYSEFQPLEEVIVGSTYNPSALDNDPRLPDQQARDLLKRVFTETAEDLENLVKILKDEGIIVQRPEIKFDPSKEYALGEFNISFTNHPLQPRDVLGFYGNKIIEAYLKDRTRYFEHWSSYNILKEYAMNGANWLSMPKPVLDKDWQTTYEEYYKKGAILFHNANLIKCGKDIFHSQSNQKDSVNGKGTEHGLEWYKKQLPEFTFNEVPIGGHVDGKIAIIKPGLLITWKKEWIPDKLKSWDCIIAKSGTKFPEDFKSTRKQRYYKDYVQRWLSHWIGYVDETVFDVNVLSISEDKVICTGTDQEVFKQLENHGVTPIYWKFRHQYFWDGGVHCLTADVRRKGEQENYF